MRVGRGRSATCRGRWADLASPTHNHWTRPQLYAQSQGTWLPLWLRAQTKILFKQKHKNEHTYNHLRGSVMSCRNNAGVRMVLIGGASKIDDPDVVTSWKQATFLLRQQSPSLLHQQEIFEHTCLPLGQTQAKRPCAT